MERTKVLWGVGGGALGAMAAWMLLSPPAPPKVPTPMNPVPAKPLVKPDEPKPKRPRWDVKPAPAVAGQDEGTCIFTHLTITQVIGDTEPAVDLLAMPRELRPNNISSRGAGCCTFRSAEYAARWQNEPALFGLPEWMKAKGIMGGGTPTKQAAMVRQISEERGMPAPLFVQYEGKDPALIELALKTGRLPCVTWQGNHMLCCVHLDDTRAAILDNNDPHRVQWFSRAEFLRKWTQGGGGWTFVLLAAPPAPPPTSGTRITAPPCNKAECDCGCKDGETCRCAVAATRATRASWFAVTWGQGCSPDCTCGCNDGRECACGGCPLVDKARALAGEFVAGVEWTFGGFERWTVNDVLVSRSDVEAALSDDTAKLHLTVIGTPEQRRAAVEAIGQTATNYLVQGYEPGHWVLSCGHVAGSTGPTTYLQRRDGKPLLRREGVAGLAEALRRADPTYQPASDPNGDTIGTGAIRDFLAAHWPGLALALAGLGGVWYLTRSKDANAAASVPAQVQNPHVLPGTPYVAPPATATRPTPPPTVEDLVARLLAAIESRQRPPAG